MFVCFPLYNKGNVINIFPIDSNNRIAIVYGKGAGEMETISRLSKHCDYVLVTSVC